MADDANISLMDVCDAIETTLGAATGMQTQQSYDEVEPSIRSGDLPCIQIYPQTGSCDPSGAADRTTFGAGIRQREYIIHADLYARKRSHLRDDMAKTVEMVEAVEDVLEVQDHLSAFSLDGIKDFAWRWERVVFEMAQNEYYMGARFFITVRIW